jgi:hypothetical protein
MTSFPLPLILAVLGCVAGCGGREVSSGADVSSGAEDGGQCTDLVVAPADLACTQNADCTYTLIGTLCAGYAPNGFCSVGVANSAAAARIASQIASVPRGSPTAPGHCEGDYGVQPRCMQGQCVPCGTRGCAEAGP